MVSIAIVGCNLVLDLRRSIGEYKAKLLMRSDAIIRRQIRSARAHKLLSALTPPSRMVCPVVSTRIADHGELVQGGLASTEWEKEVENSVRVERRVTFVSSRYQVLFEFKTVPWYAAIDEDGPK